VDVDVGSVDEADIVEGSEVVVGVIHHTRRALELSFLHLKRRILFKLSKALSLTRWQWT